MRECMYASMRPREFPAKPVHVPHALPRLHAFTRRPAAFFLVPCSDLCHSDITLFDEHPGLKCDKLL